MLETDSKIVVILAFGWQSLNALLAVHERNSKRIGLLKGKSVGHGKFNIKLIWVIPFVLHFLS